MNIFGTMEEQKTPNMQGARASFFYLLKECVGNKQIVELSHSVKLPRGFEV
jgi:hypothetical protein